MQRQVNTGCQRVKLFTGLSFKKLRQSPVGGRREQQRVDGGQSLRDIAITAATARQCESHR